jgi:anti-sigma-K factor RskA
MDALGRLDAAEHAELATHLATCEECRATSAELASTVGALDKLRTGEPSVRATLIPAHLAQAVFADINTSDDGINHGRRFRRVALAGASIAAVVVAAVVVTAGMTHSAPPTKSVALQGAQGVTATAVLVEKPWGTSLTIHEQGLMSGQIYTVSMDNPHGRWWTAGSYRTTSAAPVEATMACAAQFDSIYEIRVTDSSGRAVLSNESKPTY